MNRLCLAIVTGAVCICSAVADAAPPWSATGPLDRWFWSVLSGALLIILAIALVASWAADR